MDGESRNGSANAGVCHGRKDRANPTWVRPGVPSDSLREPDCARGLCVALLRLLLALADWWRYPPGGGTVFFLADKGGSLCVYTDTHTAMLEAVMDV